MIMGCSKHYKQHFHPFLCTYEGCGKSFQYKKDLPRHTKEVHEDSPPLRCTFPGCTSKLARVGTTRRDNLKRHIRSKHEAGNNL